MATKNLGQVSGVYINTTPPENTTLIWYDNTPSINRHKVYDAGLGKWVVLDQNVITSITYSELTNKAKNTGLSVGQWFMIKDKGNALALTITSTKVQYDDAVGNILIDDLGTNIQYHVTSSNLTIDDVAGVFDNANSKLTFRFTDATPDANNEDYLLGKIKRNNVWSLVKYKLSSLISKVTGNSITWNGGLFFNLKKALEDATDITGGWVSYDEYVQAVDALRKAIDNVGKENQGIIENAKSALQEATKPESIYGAKLPSLDTTGEPVDIAKGDTLLNIVAKVQRFINRFKYADGIRIPANYADKTTIEWINNNDTVSSAFAKLQHNVRYIDHAGHLSDDWVDHNSGPGILQEVEKGDSLGTAITKIVVLIHNLRNTVATLKLSNDWEAKDWNTEIALPAAGDTLNEAFAKVVGKLDQIGDITSSGFTSKQKRGDVPFVSLNSSNGVLALKSNVGSGGDAGGTVLSGFELDIVDGNSNQLSCHANSVRVKSVDSVKQVIADLDEGLKLTSTDGKVITLQYSEGGQSTGMNVFETGKNSMECTTEVFRLKSSEGNGYDEATVSLENGIFHRNLDCEVAMHANSGLVVNSPTRHAMSLPEYDTNTGDKYVTSALFSYKKIIPSGTDSADVSFATALTALAVSGIGSGNVRMIDAYFQTFKMGALHLGAFVAIGWVHDITIPDYCSLVIVPHSTTTGVYFLVLPSTPIDGRVITVVNAMEASLSLRVGINSHTIEDLADNVSAAYSITCSKRTVSTFIFARNIWYHNRY